MEWLPRHKMHYFRNILRDIAHNPLKQIASLVLKLETDQGILNLTKPISDGCLFIFDERRRKEEEIKWIQ